MNISILCSSTEHPVYKTLEHWKNNYSKVHEIELVQSVNELSGGAILFLISCGELINKDVRDRYEAALVIHACALPEGRGWSPHIWQIIEGKKNMTVTLLDAEDKVDSGAIWAQRELYLEGHELHDEINEKLFALESELMDFAVENIETVSPVPQRDMEPSYYSKRTQEDSRLNPNRTIAEQFDLLRVCDPVRFPAFFTLRGHNYRIKIEKIKTDGVD